jgi:hypothetical protein
MTENKSTMPHKQILRDLLFKDAFDKMLEDRGKLIKELSDLYNIKSKTCKSNCKKNGKQLHMVWCSGYQQYCDCPIYRGETEECTICVASKQADSLIAIAKKRKDAVHSAYMELSEATLKASQIAEKMYLDNLYDPNVILTIMTMAGIDLSDLAKSYITKIVYNV